MKTSHGVTINDKITELNEKVATIEYKKIAIKNEIDILNGDYNDGHERTIVSMHAVIKYQPVKDFSLELWDLILEMGGIHMITIISILLMILLIWLTFKIVPAILGFTFTVLLAILQVIGVILLLPVLGLAFVLLDVIVIGGIFFLIKLIC